MPTMTNMFGRKPIQDPEKTFNNWYNAIKNGMRKGEYATKQTTRTPACLIDNRYNAIPHPTEEQTLQRIQMLDWCREAPVSTEPKKKSDRANYPSVYRRRASE